MQSLLGNAFLGTGLRDDIAVPLGDDIPARQTKVLVGQVAMQTDPGLRLAVAACAMEHDQRARQIVLHGLIAVGIGTIGRDGNVTAAHSVADDQERAFGRVRFVISSFPRPVAQDSRDRHLQALDCQPQALATRVALGAGRQRQQQCRQNGAACDDRPATSKALDGSLLIQAERDQQQGACEAEGLGKVFHQNTRLR